MFGEVQVNAPRVEGLSRFLRDFRIKVNDVELHPVYKVDEMQVDMTKRLLARVYVSPEDMERLRRSGTTLEDLQLKLFNYMLAALPTPRVMGVVSFGLEVKIEDPAGGHKELKNENGR